MFSYSSDGGCDRPAGVPEIESAKLRNKERSKDDLPPCILRETTGTGSVKKTYRGLQGPTGAYRGLQGPTEIGRKTRERRNWRKNQHNELTAATRGEAIASPSGDTMAGHTGADDTTGVTVTGVIISRPDSEDPIRRIKNK